MTEPARKITLDQWDARYCELRRRGMREPAYGGPLRRHLEDGDRRLLRLRLDDSPAALRLWNFLLTEEGRLHQAQAAGKKLVGTMKDLGTVPVLACSFDNLVAFYPDGAWWIPCVMEGTSAVLRLADRLGIDDSFCPVRAMLGALECDDHFPHPGLLPCSVGATCDDVSAIAQRLESLGHPVFWWEMPHRRRPEPGEPIVELPGGFCTTPGLVAFVRGELERVRRALEEHAGQSLSDEQLATGIARANGIRLRVGRLRELAYTAPCCPLPALEMLIAEMLSIHYCSDQAECAAVLDDLLELVEARVAAGGGVLPADAVRVYWINPVADLRAMNLLEDLGGRVCGSEYLFCHALDLIPTDLPPLEALARMALADPMVGSPGDRAARIAAEIRRFGAEAAVISRIPGASHCALEGNLLGEIIRAETGVPVVEFEVPSLADALEPALQTRLEALLELARPEDGMIAAGIDVGSRAIKVVLLETATRHIRAAGAVDQGIEQNDLAMGLLDDLLGQTGLDRSALTGMVATGYGRRLIRAAGATITEITCQGRGVRHLVSEARTIIDIGGQDSKVLRLDERGAVSDFVMNDRCAAGTGRFLEVVATRLGVRLVELGELARRSQAAAAISSMCVVFAETEIVGLLASGARPEDMAAGVQAAMAGRIAGMVGPRAAGPVVFTGGVALVPGMADALAAALGQPVAIAPQPQMTAALGAALLA